ncbi:MAG: OmpH family outer membrane protein [Bacteroidaceae bacterium]|nr:OmpH family outer membrane protein [Bacteroidaceae bacterium]
MKKIITLAAIAVAALTASAQKFAHYDYATVVQALPEYKTATAELEATGKQYQTDLEEMQKEIQTRYEKYQTEVNDQTPANIRQRKEQEIMDLQQRFQQAQEDNAKAFQELQSTKMQPIVAKVSDAVAAVAKEGGYVYVFDKSQSGPNFYINEAISEDVTAKIRTKLGI